MKSADKLITFELQHSTFTDSAMVNSVDPWAPGAPGTITDMTDEHTLVCLYPEQNNWLSDLRRKVPAGSYETLSITTVQPYHRSALWPSKPIDFVEGIRRERSFAVSWSTRCTSSGSVGRAAFKGRVNPWVTPTVKRTSTGVCLPSDDGWA